MTLTAAAGLVVSVGSFFLVRSGAERAWQAEFGRRVEVPAVALQRGLEEDLQSLRAVAALYLSSRLVERGEFQTFAQSILERSQGVDGVEWIPRLPDAARAAHEQAARQQGVPWYQIQDRDSQGHWARAPRRAGYYPIYFVAPRARSEELGWDLALNPADLEAMGWARDQSREIAGAPFPRLAGAGTNLIYRCRVFTAVFTNLAAHASVEERRRNLAGYAAVQINFNGLLEGTLRRMKAETWRGLAWQLVDETNRSRPPLRLHESGNWAAAVLAGSALELKIPLVVGGRTWVWHCRPAPGMDGGRADARAWAVMAAGLLITTLLCVSMASALGRTAQVEALVQERTAALDRSNQDLREEIERRTQMEAALEAERQWVNALLENIPDHIYFKDRESRFLRINTAMARRFKLGMPEEAVGRTDFDFFTAEHAERAFADEQEILRTGEPLIGREEMETWPDGTTSWVSSTKQCLRDKAGHVLGTFGISRDITLRKEAEKRLAEQKQELAAKALELERSNRELEQFAYVASHDLQEPLRMIASYTQLLGRRYGQNLDDDGHQFIRFAVEGAARMQELINDLLAYSRVGTKAKAFAPTDCGQILNRALKNLEIAIQESGAEITATPLPVVPGDPTQLTQLLQNLIGNALKFSGDKPPRVHLRAEPEGIGSDRGWHLAVSDAGIGIDPKYFDRIFVIFQRLHTRDEYPGTGIGLAVCKKIVERHGGRIWVESTPGQGATFHFILPAEVDAKAGAGLETSAGPD